MPEGGSAAPAGARLGTFAGVFTPSLLTILGIILFLRLGYLVGSSGLRRTLAVIAVANAISVLTSLSVAAISTNHRVKGGGDYYLISRTLGLGFGGAIGLVLFLAQSVSVGFYCMGFAEAAAILLLGTDGGLTRLVAGAAVLELFVLTWLGADWATRFQYFVLAALTAALGVFVLGSAGAWDGGLLDANWAAPLGGLPFWTAFAIFFPAVTGFTQGVSMSGDLANPARSIPKGVLSAVALSVVIYFGCAVLLAGTLPGYVLRGDYLAMKRLAAFAPLIDLGIVAATLSSALASFLGAPRIFQSLARDEVFPVLRGFARGSGPADNPRRAVLLTGSIALAVIGLGDLNRVAPVVSMFFLISYGLLNYATYFEARIKSPSFRPTFRVYHPAVGLVGAIAALEPCWRSIRSPAPSPPPSSSASTATLMPATSARAGRTPGARTISTRRGNTFWPRRPSPRTLGTGDPSSSSSPTPRRGGTACWSSPPGSRAAAG
jgi:amino acid transporter